MIIKAVIHHWQGGLLLKHDYLGSKKLNPHVVTVILTQKWSFFPENANVIVLD